MSQYANVDRPCPFAMVDVHLWEVPKVDTPGQKFTPSMEDPAWYAKASCGSFQPCMQMEHHTEIPDAVFFKQHHAELASPACKQHHVEASSIVCKQHLAEGYSPVCKQHHAELANPACKQHHAEAHCGAVTALSQQPCAKEYPGRRVNSPGLVPISRAPRSALAGVLMLPVWCPPVVHQEVPRPAC
eukprot:352607-Chlamydomonas_euryale.AAC.1